MSWFRSGSASRGDPPVENSNVSGPTVGTPGSEVDAQPEPRSITPQSSSAECGPDPSFPNSPTPAEPNVTADLSGGLTGMGWSSFGVPSQADPGPSLLSCRPESVDRNDANGSGSFGESVLNYRMDQYLGGSQDEPTSLVMESDANMDTSGTMEGMTGRQQDVWGMGHDAYDALFQVDMQNLPLTNDWLSTSILQILHSNGD